MTSTMGALPRIETHCRAIDELMDGGLPTGTITQIFGEKALGKSIISFQTACAAVAGGMSAVVLDTEQSYASYLVPYWQPRFSKRFGKEIKVYRLKVEKNPKPAGKKKPVTRGQVISAFSNSLDQLGVFYTESHLGSLADIVSPELHVQLPEDEDPSIMVLEIPEVTELLALHGVDAKKQVSEGGGRVELRLQSTPVYQSILFDVMQKTGAKLLVYDSVSAPFKAAFANTADLPARSAGLAMILSHAQRLCVEFGLAIEVVSHVTINPMSEWDRRPYGGIILGHEAKFSLELTKSTAKRNSKGSPSPINPEEEEACTKAFWVARHPAMEEFKRFGYSRQDDEGFH